MRLITYSRGASTRLGAWIDGDRRIVDLRSAAEISGGDSGPFHSMQALIDAGPNAWDRARGLVAEASGDAVLESAGARILAPLPQPAQVRDCLCFPSHLQGTIAVRLERQIAASSDPAATRRSLEEAGAFDVPASYFEFPVYYTANRFATFGLDDDIVWPTFSSFIDYEFEWAAVIGRRGIAIDKADARGHIFGYTIFNDWSARDEQMKVMGGALNVGPGAGKDFANSFGPCIVTSDEVPNPYDLAMKVRINGELISTGSTAGMHFDFEDLIVSISRAHHIEPGEILGSGTVGGGCSLETGRTVLPGDVIELDLERVGVLRNRVLAPHLTGGR